MARKAGKPVASRAAPRPPDAREITRRLLQRYPNARTALRFSNPLELLVATILSAQCTDVRVNMVTETLFKKYRRAADYARVDPAVFEQEIRSTGFYRSKAKSVIACARKLVEDFGGEVPDRMEQLVTLPGVGRKTANVVLGNAFGRPAIAVDTHVTRVANRLGLVRSDDPDEIEAALAAVVPPDKQTAFGSAMILHGRETCVARKPRCPDCILLQLCQWPDKTV
ncbi:MAG: endonuclease III [Dongiaceae bacterium]